MSAGQLTIIYKNKNKLVWFKQLFLISLIISLLSLPRYDMLKVTLWWCDSGAVVWHDMIWWVWQLCWKITFVRMAAPDDEIFIEISEAVSRDSCNPGRDTLRGGILYQWYHSILSWCFLLSDGVTHFNVLNKQRIIN